MSLDEQLVLLDIYRMYHGPSDLATPRMSGKYPRNQVTSLGISLAKTPPNMSSIKLLVILFRKYMTYHGPSGLLSIHRWKLSRVKI